MKKTKAKQCWKQLINAITTNNLVLFDELIVANKLDEVTSETGDTILHYCSRGHGEFVKRILVQNLNVDIRNDDNKTPLHEAAQFGQVGIARILLDKGATVDALKKSDWTPLMLACTKNNTGDPLETCKLLLSNGASVNYKNKDGWTALHIACREGNIDVVKLLLKNNADVNLRTKNGRTCLHIASLHGNLSNAQTCVTEELLQKGCKILKDNCGNTPFHEAALSGNIKMVELLIKYNLCVNDVTNEGYTALHLVASIGNIAMASFLLNNCKLNVNESSNNKFTALHVAAKSRQLKMFEYLVSVGANVFSLDAFGRLPKDYF